MLDQKFRVREEEVKSLGQKAMERHTAMVQGYREALEDYLSLMERILKDGQGSQAIIDEIETLHDKIIHKKKRPLLGALPYRNLNYPPREPNQDPPIKPAYRGGNRAVGPGDLKGTVEAPISGEIANLAQSLNWSPVSIYEYVKNTIETEWVLGVHEGGRGDPEAEERQ